MPDKIKDENSLPKSDIEQEAEQDWAGKLYTHLINMYNVFIYELSDYDAKLIGDTLNDYRNKVIIPKAENKTQSLTVSNGVEAIEFVKFYLKERKAKMNDAPTKKGFIYWKDYPIEDWYKLFKTQKQ